MGLVVELLVGGDGSVLMLAGLDRVSLSLEEEEEGVVSIFLMPLLSFFGVFFGDFLGEGVVLVSCRRSGSFLRGGRFLPVAAAVPLLIPGFDCELPRRLRDGDAGWD